MTPSSNPFFQPWSDPFETPPFSRITPEHFRDGFARGMQQHQQEIDTIARSTASPTFANTAVALEQSGAALQKVSAVFFALHAVNADKAMQALAVEVSPQLAQHADAISMNEALFARIDAVFAQRETLSLSPEEERLLEKTHRDFVRSGARLAPPQKERLMAINARLSLLSLQFQENLLGEDDAFQLRITDEAELAGLPPSLRASGKERAVALGHPEDWVFTLHRSVWTPFMQHCAHRAHRRTMFAAYTARGSQGNDRDNRAVLCEQVALRHEKAALLGYPHWAAYVLDENMARTDTQVSDFLAKLWAPAVANARREQDALEARMHQDGIDGALQPWDWWFYAERLREENYALNDAVLREYFSLDAVQAGAFDVAHRLFGLRFVPRGDIAVYHADVRVFEVLDAAGDHVGLLYYDYFQRPFKNQGAWMTEFRTQRMQGGARIAPLVVNACNFTSPPDGAEVLLSLEEVETLFHEFGHALHGLLSQAQYATMAGTNVVRDFVELPSQFMENWAFDRRFIRTYARHWQSGAPIPDALVTAIENARHFNQGFETVEYLAASLLDMTWHASVLPTYDDIDVDAFERALFAKLGMPQAIAPRYRSTYFAHIFSGGYSAGYYSYIWAAVLDADAFSAFSEKENLFDAATARAFLQHILSSGDTEDPMVLFQRFRGRNPDIGPLLARRGLRTADVQG
ncbi:MAG: M3 family metallopeptidase [Proteobacteria bacterium]|nr:M3 family metallopeptidase [Pseudomonadota bacterium]